MDRPAYDDSDENEPSLPDPQLSAVTEALLAHAGLGTTQRSIASPHEQIDKGESIAAQVTRSSRTPDLPPLPSSQHRNPTSLRTDDDGLNSDGLYNTPTGHIVSLQQRPKRRPKQSIPAPPPEFPNLNEHNTSDHVPAREHQADMAPTRSLQSDPAGPGHTAETAPPDVPELAPSVARGTGRTRIHEERSPSVPGTAHNRLPNYCNQEPRSAPARGMGHQIASQSPSHDHDNANQGPLPYRNMITPENDVVRGDSGKPRSPDVREAPVTVKSHQQQADVFPTPRNSAHVPRMATTSTDAPAQRVVTVPEKRKSARRFLVNGEPYIVARRLGKGGSGRVYEVISKTNKIWAFKTIPLNNLDERGKTQIRNEVRLLETLTEADRVVCLKDWAFDEAKKALYIVMELGQVDLDNIIRDRYATSAKLDVAFASYYWLEMLKCVSLIHSLDIVHSDLKPANFVLINGVLKLVDFGIANAIADDTINVYKDHQAGTPNYMAPETLKALSMPASTQQDLSRLFRFGKPSDVWSLGCILHLMVYGRQPFGHIQALAPKLMAISDPAHVIEFSEKGLGDVQVPSSFLRTMNACLLRDPSQRPTASSLLEKDDGLLEPEGRTGNVVYVTSQTMEGLFTNALQQEGAWASQAEIKTWAGKVIENLENERTERQDK